MRPSLFLYGGNSCVFGIKVASIALKSAGEEIARDPSYKIRWWFYLAYLLFVMALNLSGFSKFNPDTCEQRNIGHKLVAKHMAIPEHFSPVG